MPTIKATPQRTTDADVLAVPVYAGGAPGAGAKEAATALGESLADLLGSVKGELGDAVAVPTLGKLPARQVLFVGLGPKAAAKRDAVRKAGAVVARRTASAKTVATTIPGDVAAFTEGYLLGAYRFDRYKSASNGAGRATTALTLLGQGKGAAAAIERGTIMAEATNLARDLTNTPAGDLYPEVLAAEARKVKGLSVTVMSEKQLATGGFGGLLGVGQGSQHPPRMVVLKYEPAGAKRRIALVGKSITFDSGGINLKNQSLDWMKMDMGGGAAVLGAMHAIARLRPKVAVWGILCAAENMPGGKALHPGDIITIRGGTTVEVIDTDAEGRLVLADGITYAVENEADVIVDVATLTGACVVALGNRVFGVMGNAPKEVKGVLAAAKRAGELAWELPLVEEYRKVMDSEIADLRNIASRPVGGGTITAGLFLRGFAKDTPWVHLDIAGPAKSDAEEFEIPKGGTGTAVRTLVEFVTG